MSKLLVGTLAVAALAAPVRAQSINVDFGPAGSPFRSPPPSYGASASSAGVWNPVGSTVATHLKKWDGTPTDVSLSMTGVTPNGCGSLFWTYDHANTSGEDAALLDDGHSCDELQILYDFDNLEAGDYTVDTIVLGSSCLTAVVEVSVQGSPDPGQYVYPDWSGAYVQGSNFARHTVTVTNGTIQIEVDWVMTIADYLHVVGIQLNKHDQTFLGTFQCYGDGTAAACPCANSGDPGFGCQNSAGTGGAFLHASGTTSPDTVVLHSSGELPTSFSIFLQGNATVPSPAAYGDGLRCTGGILKRLYKKSASAGAVSAPAPGDPSITTRSASLGDAIPPGERRYYQVYYRDPNPSFCPVPSGSTFNISNSVKITW